jgi:hypothetical protein
MAYVFKGMALTLQECTISTFYTDVRNTVHQNRMDLIRLSHENIYQNQVNDSNPTYA